MCQFGLVSGREGVDFFNCNNDKNKKMGIDKVEKLLIKICISSLFYIVS